MLKGLNVNGKRQIEHKKHGSLFLDQTSPFGMKMCGEQKTASLKIIR
jgi:hypothetical protein